MGKSSWKIRHYRKGIYLSVIILLFFLLTCVEGQRYNTRRRAGYPRRRYVNQRARNQYRPEQVVGRDRAFRNRNTQRRGDINPVNYRIQRLEYLRHQRAQIETEIDRQNVRLQRKMFQSPGRASTAHDSHTYTGRDSVLQNYRMGNSADANIVQRQNNNRRPYENRNIGSDNMINPHIEKTSNAQNRRTAVVNNRRRNVYVRPRGQRTGVEVNRNSVENKETFTRYSPLLSRRNVSPRTLPLEQNTDYTRRHSRSQFKPFNSNYLRQLSAQNKMARSRKYYPLVHSSSSGHVTSRQIRPTRQSFPSQPIAYKVYQMEDRGNTIQDRNIIVDTLDSPAQQIQVGPTKGTLVQNKIIGQTRDNIQKVLIPLPSIVPAHGTSSGPVGILRRTALQNGKAILKVVPLSNSVVQTAGSLLTAVPKESANGRNALSVQQVEQPSVSARTNVTAPQTVDANIPVPKVLQQVPITSNLVQPIAVPSVTHTNVVLPKTNQQDVHVPNTFQSNAQVQNTVPHTYPMNPWLNQLLLGREQPDSPDPTEAVKTVTELVNLLSSVVPDLQVAEEEEEIEWEDIPSTTTTTTTTTTTPNPTTSSPATPKNVIKSIAERIVSLLIRRSGGKGTPKVNNKHSVSQTNAQTTRTEVRPTFPSQLLDSNNGRGVNIAGPAKTEIVLERVQPTFPSFTPSNTNPIVEPNLSNMVSNNILTQLASHPTIRSIIKSNGFPQGAAPTVKSGQLNLNDVILSDTLPKMRTDSVVDRVVLEPYMSSNDLGGLSVKKIVPIPNGVKKSSVNFEPEKVQSNNVVVKALLEKIKKIVATQDVTTTTTTTTVATTTKAPTTLAPTTPAPTPPSLPNTCKPGSPNFQCRGKDMFQAIESIGAWCIGMCFKRGCINTVCTCGCNLPPTQISPSAIPLTPTQRRHILNSFDSSLWKRTTENPITTEEPPEEEEEEWEPEDGTTTKAHTTTENPRWTVPWGGGSPSPQSDFQLNPIDQHSSNVKQIDQHISELKDVAWASQIKNRLKQLAANADNSTNADAAIAGWNKVQTTPGSKAPPNWQGTEWFLETPAPKKPPTTQKPKTVKSNTWQRRPLRDKWGRSERFTGGGESDTGNSHGWNMWNNPWQMSSFGNNFGNSFGGDSRLNRFRFNWGGSSGSSGSGGEENEAADK